VKIQKKSKRGEFGFEIRTEVRLKLTGLGEIRQKTYPESSREARLAPGYGSG
jgi:hypothetical protein